MSGFNSFVMLLGRLLLSSFFIWAGVSKILNFDDSVQLMEAHGLTNVSWMVIAACVIELVGGFSLLLGFWTRWGALLLFFYLIAYCYFFYNFWAIEGAEMHVKKVQFLMNLGLMGGLLYVFGAGAGHISCDGKCHSDSSSSCCK